MTYDNPPAFPRTGEDLGNPLYDEAGMTLRDWFAGQALATMPLSSGSGDNWTAYRLLQARTAYSYADAMLAARKEKSK